MYLPEKFLYTNFIIGFFFSIYIVLDPPSPPIISGYVEGSIIPAGSVQKLLCVSSGGNPLATLTWYKNDKKVRKFYLYYIHIPLYLYTYVI